MFEAVSGVDFPSKYRRVPSLIWDDFEFRNFDYHTQNAYIFVHTHKNMSPLGVLQSSVSALCDERSEHVKPTVFRRAIDSLTTAGWLWLPSKKSVPIIIEPKFLNTEPPTNPNQIKCWANIIRYLPQCDILLYYLYEIIDSADQFGEALAEPMREVLEEAIEKAFPKALREDIAKYREQRTENREQRLLPLLSPPARVGQQQQSDKARIRWNPERAKNEKDGWEGIEESDIVRWKTAYPACDIRRQLAAMDSWCRSNPAKAKKSNWPRFVTNWLSRAQDRGGDAKSAPARTKAQEYAESIPAAKKITGMADIDALFGGKSE